MEDKIPFANQPVPEYVSPFKVDLPVECTDPERSEFYPLTHSGEDDCPVHDYNHRFNPAPPKVPYEWKSWVKAREVYATSPPGTDPIYLGVLLDNALRHVTEKYRTRQRPR